jgi:hypothetical protein
MPRKSDRRATGYISNIDKLNLREEIKHRHHKKESKVHNEEDSC